LIKLFELISLLVFNCVTPNDESRWITDKEQQMSIALNLPKNYTLAEYFALEEQLESRNEYYQGEVFDMVGASINHNRITSNLHGLLYLALKQNNTLELFANDMKVYIVETDSITYPDIVVIQTPPVFHEEREDTITNPLLIIEVLSKSTADYDKGKKFDAYRTLPSFQEYLLVDQYSPRLTHFVKQQEKHWLMQEIGTENGQCSLRTLNITLQLNDIYQRVSF
jgi:Uma2 family endonuclease